MASYQEDENGYVTFPDTPLSKPGIFEYAGREISPTLEPDRIYKVWRPEEELNSIDTIESFKLSPWFPRHEMSGEGFTDAEQIGVQGTTGQDVRYIEGVGLIGTVKTFGTQLKKAIKTGLRELSCGFRCRWDIVSGTTPDGLKYDVVQRDIRGNHLASVEQGRMGADVSVAMDAAHIALDNVKLEGDNMSIEELMAKVKEAQPAKEELAKLYADIGAMLSEGGEPEAEPEMDADPKPEDEPAMDEPADKADDPKPEEKPAMDEATAKRIKDLEDQVETLKGSAMDAETVEARINAKNDLISKLTPVVGVIDGTGMDVNGVARKAAEIMGLACDSKTALATVTGYLAGKTSEGTTIDKGAALDAKTASTAIMKTLDDMGI